MAYWTKLTLIALGVIVVALALSLWLGSRWQQRALARLTAALVRGSSREGASHVT